MRWKEHNTSDFTLGFKFWMRNTGVQRQLRHRESGTEQPECVKEHGRLSREMWTEKDGGWEWVRMTRGIRDVTTRDGGATCDVATEITVVLYSRALLLLYSRFLYPGRLGCQNTDKDRRQNWKRSIQRERGYKMQMCVRVRVKKGVHLDLR